MGNFKQKPKHSQLTMKIFNLALLSAAATAIHLRGDDDPAFDGTAADQWDGSATGENWEDKADDWVGHPDSDPALWDEDNKDEEGPRDGDWSRDEEDKRSCDCGDRSGSEKSGSEKSGSEKSGDEEQGEELEELALAQEGSAPADGEGSGSEDKDGSGSEDKDGSEGEEDKRSRHSGDRSDKSDDDSEKSDDGSEKSDDGSEKSGDDEDKSGDDEDKSGDEEDEDKSEDELELAQRDGQGPPEG